MELDEKNKIILEYLQKNCRAPLTEIAELVGLSVDSVKKRIKRMIEQNIFYPKIQLRPRHFGYPNIVEVNIRLGNLDSESRNQFIDYLKKHPRVTQIIELSGDCDLKIVIIAKDYEDQGIVTRGIKNRFSKIILGWTEYLTTRVYKFEEYKLFDLDIFNEQLAKER